jgi:protein-tyrosine phosphatase
MSRDCQEVIPGLYIGHLWCATDGASLTRKRIRHVVDVSARVYEPPPGTNVLRIPIPDEPWFDIRTVFGMTNAFIARSLRMGEPVLVHCLMGISRSASVVIAYLLAFHHLSLDQSLALLRSKRSICNPNPGFIRFLKAYETELQQYRARNNIAQNRLPA